MDENDTSWFFKPILACCKTLGVYQPRPSEGTTQHLVQSNRRSRDRSCSQRRWPPGWRNHPAWSSQTGENTVVGTAVQWDLQPVWREEVGRHRKAAIGSMPCGHPLLPPMDESHYRGVGRSAQTVVSYNRGQRLKPKLQQDRHLRPSWLHAGQQAVTIAFLFPWHP